MAREVLRLSGPEEVIARVARRALAELPGARPGPDGRWRIAEPEADRAVALVTRTTGPVPPQDLLLQAGAAEIHEGRLRRVLSVTVRPDRPLGSAAAAAAGVDPADLAGGIPLAEAVSRLADLLRGARAVCLESDLPAAFLRRLRPDAFELPPGETIVLLPALRRAGLVPPRGGLAEAAGSLRVPAPETGEAEGLAKTVAQLYLAALDRGADLSPPAPRPRFDFGRTAFGPDLLAELPTRPGVYRFLDRAGRVLYVGKARDLRTRVSSYFGHRSRRRSRYGDLMERLHSLEWEETGSEVQALLAEIRQIRETAPPYNVQREVRRRRPESGDLVLFLPGRDEGDIELLLVRAGRPAGRMGTDRRARGMRQVRAALREIFFSGEPTEAPEDPAGAQILASWLRSEGDAQNFLDLSTVSGMKEAARLVKAYVRDPDLFRGRVIHR